MVTSPPASRFVITCEHGGNDIPTAYQTLFENQQALLDTHRGYDHGALLMAKEFAEAMNAKLVSATVSRLLVDLNRSIGHPRHLSEFTRTLPEAVRHAIIDEHYTPYRAQVAKLIADAIAAGQKVIHISSHSFTPELNGEVRLADVGLLYDPSRAGEVELCSRWKHALQAQLPELSVRRNYPYQGKNDGQTAALRQCHTPAEYIGIELEVNQAIVKRGGAGWMKLRQALIASLRSACSTE